MLKSIRIKLAAKILPTGWHVHKDRKKKPKMKNWNEPFIDNKDEPGVWAFERPD